MSEKDDLYSGYESEFEDVPENLRYNYVSELFHSKKIDNDVEISSEQLMLVRANIGRRSFTGIHARLVLEKRGAESIGPEMTMVPLIETYVELFGASAVRHMSLEMQSAYKKRELESALCM